LTSTQASVLTWPEYEQRITEGAIVFLPVGAFEQHGLHLPLNTDTVVARAVAEQVAGRVDGLVLPAVEYGARSLPRSGGGDSFPATTNLVGDSLARLVADVVHEQLRHGARHFVVVLGHGENEPFVLEGVEQARRTSPDPDMKVMVAGWWHFLVDEDLIPFFPDGFPGWDREHAARVETALMLALKPELVRPLSDEEIDPVIVENVTVVPHQPDEVPRQGSLSDPRGATTEMGDRLVVLIVERFSDAIARRMQQ
jgi:creatinine amidohydrolase